jgi:fluoride exporter
MIKVIYLIIGGTLGTLARYGASGCIYSWFGTDFPYGTFVVNIFGCLCVGFLAAITTEKFLLGPNLRVLLMIGFCGAFTTFSTFMLETTYLMREGQNMKAFLNIFLSIFIGFLALRAGVLFGEAI